MRIGPPDPALHAFVPAAAGRAPAAGAFAGVLAATTPRELLDDAAALRSAAVDEPAGAVRGRHNARLLSELGPALREAQIQLPWLCECADEWCEGVVRSTASAF